MPRKARKPKHNPRRISTLKVKVEHGLVQKPAGRSGRVERIKPESIKPEDTPRA